MQRDGSTGSRFRGVPAAVRETVRGSSSVTEAVVNVSVTVLPVSVFCIVAIVLIELVLTCFEELDKVSDELTDTGDCRY